MPKRVAVIGPESTGKSTLCVGLADYYATSWVPEYAREYLSSHGLKYSYDDLLVIARTQIKIEDQIAAASSGLVFIDTNLYVMKVWCEFVYGKCHQWILNTIAQRSYDLYLLCNIDIPWEFQEMREYPDFESRQRLFHMYKDILVNQEVPWSVISGTKNARLESAIKAIKKLVGDEPYITSDL
jgi:NadR type nicotinamide-nucleotide adenylyltransferase